MSSLIQSKTPRAAASFPAFEPHPLLRGGHAQTIGGRYLPARPSRLRSVQHLIKIGEGNAEDVLSVFEDVPDAWRNGQPAAMLLHGLAGTARSPYIERVADRLVRIGVRVVRVNLRGAGEGFDRAKGFYHAGRTEDLGHVLDWLNQRAPGSPVGVVGFSLGANLALRLAAEASRADALHPIDCVVAANPPIDLRASCLFLQQPGGRKYDRHFVKLLRRDLERRRTRFPNLDPIDWSRIRSVYDFDDAYTAPRNGFTDAEDYYARCSSGPVIPSITIPGLVIHAEDDPFIPVDAFLSTLFPPNLALELMPSGGHLGYVARKIVDIDRRWLDARIVAWLADRWELS